MMALLNEFEAHHLKEDLSNNLKYKYFYDCILKLIEKVGIDKYKKFVGDYNRKIEWLKESNQLRTSEEIIWDLLRQNRKVVTK